MYPANCFVIIVPLGDSRTMESEKLNYQHQNNLLQAYIDTLFQPGVNEFDKWRQSLTDERLNEIINKKSSEEV